ncbi:hypothetical protein Trco_004577 [Trichoderma cornu-damae]|uniref:TPR-like protein n=1 Tax=Trichoderma cornu-damae TaxID=654480 RepID=A0A9P8QNB5_9HYPO|nr:hypothetical protein Trco_004577 [Trichoderma cornu-damae]
MSQSSFHQRYISHSQFGNNATINQGDIHYHLPQPPRPPGVRVIPYPRNEDVVYRQDLVNKLDTILPRGSKFYSAALWGLGGSGKTQIALDYAYRRCDDPECGVFWIHADSEATFIHDYKTIAERLGIEKTADGEDLLCAVRNGIEAHPPWVLILDNADNLELFGVDTPADGTKSRLYEHLPKGPMGTVLWTSRDARIAGTLVGPTRAVEVSAMAYGEAMTLLETTRNAKAGSEELGDAEMLLKELELFPLAISQAGAYMRRMSLTATGYLSLLEESKRRWDTLKKTEFDRHRRREMPNSVLETWTVSMERIQSENITAYHVLHTIAYLDNQNLSHELIVAIGKCNDKDAVGQPEVDSAMVRLKEFSFLKMRRVDGGEPSYEIHKLVQEAARYRLNARGFRELPGQGNLLPMEKRDEAYYSGIALQVISELFPVSKPESWERCERYLAHAVGMGDWAEACKKQADISALLSKASGYLHDRGRWREKAPVDLRAIELRRNSLGERHPATLESIASLAAAYHYQGEHDKAKARYREALDLQRETLGERHPDTLRNISLLGAVHQSHGQYEEAEALYKEVLELQREILGETHVHTLQTLGSLSAVYHYQGHYEKARGLKEDGLRLQREILGEKNPYTLWNMGSLAATYQCLGRYKKAKALYQETLDLRRETLGEKHPDTLRSITQLGAIYQDMGKYGTAEALAKEALELQLKLLGEKHPYTLQSTHNLAVAWHSLGRRHEALSLMRECLEGRSAVLGSNHPFTHDSAKVLEKWESRAKRFGGVREISSAITKKLWKNGV